MGHVADPRLRHDRDVGGGNDGLCGVGRGDGIGSPVSVVVDAVEAEEPVVAFVIRPREGDCHFALAAGNGFDELVRALHHEVLVESVVANIGVPRATELEEAEISLVCFVFKFLFHFIVTFIDCSLVGRIGKPLWPPRHTTQYIKTLRECQYGVWQKLKIFWRAVFRCY